MASPGGVPYLDYIAPALLVTQAMMAAAFESAWPIMNKIMWDKTYLAALNTPLAALDLLLGDLMWIAFRAMLLAVLFLAAIIVLGAATSPLDRTGGAGGGLDRDRLRRADHGLYRHPDTATAASTPSSDSASRRSSCSRGTFFPIEQLPLFLQPLAWVTPLYHGVAVARSLSLGQVEPLA